MAYTILVVGGAGFIGVNLIRQLLNQDIQIKVLDNLSAGKAADVEGLPVELLVGDIRDEAMVDRAVQGMQAVVHLAAHTSVIDSIQEPEVNLDVNVRGTSSSPAGQCETQGGAVRLCLHRRGNHR